MDLLVPPLCPAASAFYSVLSQGQEDFLEEVASCRALKELPVQMWKLRHTEGQGLPRLHNKPYATSPGGLVHCLNSDPRAMQRLVLHPFIRCQEKLAMDSGICLFSMKKDFWNMELTKIHTSHACISYCRHLDSAQEHTNSPEADPSGCTKGSRDRQALG